MAKSVCRFYNNSAVQFYDRISKQKFNYSSVEALR